MTYNPKDPIVCPHCEEELEGVAEDYVVPGSIDYTSDEQCGYCDEWFVAVRRCNGDIVIEATDGEGGDYIE